MSWLRHDDDMLDHPKWIRALRDGGAEALLTWWRLCAWSSRRLTDGVIPVDMIGEVARVERSKSKLRALQVLVDVELCTRREDGAYVINDYLERNPSKAEVLEERERRSQAQRNRRLAKPVTGHAPISHPTPCPSPVPSRPVPSPSLSYESESARAPEVPDVPGLERVFGGGSGRVYSLPGADPPKEFLDDAVMGGVSVEQARSTWEHYHGAGLPPSGVERLHPWLVKRAKERAMQLAKAPKSGPRIVESDLDTTGAATAFRPSSDHEKFCAEKNLDLAHAVRLYRASPEHAKVGFVESERRFMTRLKCWLATGTFIPDGPLPRPPAKLKEARA